MVCVDGKPCLGKKDLLKPTPETTGFTMFVIRGA